MNVCNICFYGAVRTLEHTAPTIIDKLVTPFKVAYKINIFAVVWSDENQELVSKYNIFGGDVKKIITVPRLDPTTFTPSMITAINSKRVDHCSNTQIMGDIKEDTPGVYKGKPVIFKKHLFVSNTIQSLFALKTVTETLLASVEINPGDITIFIRPDCKVYQFPSPSEIQQSFVVSSSRMQIVTSGYDNFYYNPNEFITIKSRIGEQGGVNDRLIICHGKNTVETIGKRFNGIDDYINSPLYNKSSTPKNFLHPEGLLERLIKKNNIMNLKLPQFCLTLLRESGLEAGDCPANTNPEPSQLELQIGIDNTKKGRGKTRRKLKKRRQTRKRITYIV
jgi:hypothetical protein